MAFLLVSRERVKTALRIDHSDDDAQLDILISAASRAVARYLKGQAGDLLSINSPPDSPPNDLEAVPEDVAMAVIYLTGVWYRNPDNDIEKAWEAGYLPAPVVSLLYPLRDPAIA